MARDASQLAGTFAYQRLVTALRMAIMLRDSALSRAAARSIRVESNLGKGWDDHVESWLLNGKRVTGGWQIKQQVEPIGRAVAQALWETLATAPFDRFTLAFPESTHVSGVGTFGQLRSLTRRLQDRHPDERSLNAPERKWVKFIADAMGVGEEDVVARLANVTVEFVGSEQGLRGQIAAALAALYAPPVDHLVTALETFAHSLADGIDVTAFGLEETVLATFAGQRVRHVPTYYSDRAQYLAALSRIVDERRAGRGLFRDTPPLADVWVSFSEQLALVAEVPRDRTVRPLSPSLEHAPTAVEGPTLQSALRAGGRHVLVAPVGTGKTEALARLAGELAKAAQGTEDAPLPLLLGARTYADQRGIWEAASHDNPALREPIDRLRGNADARWIVLVDSFDEVAETDADALVANLDARGPTFFAVLAATRPSAQPLRAFTTWTLLPWTDQQVDAFLDHWEKVAPDAVHLVRGRSAALQALMATPLTATLVLIAARRAPRSVDSRAQVFKAIVADLFQTWSRGRDAPPWKDVAMPLRALARAVVEGSDGELAQDKLERILTNTVPNRERETERAAEHAFGLLVRTPSGTLDFALRPVGEFIAGEALTDAGDEELAALASLGWAEEPLRHAIGLMDSSRAESAVRSLLALAARGELRPLIVALRASADRTDLSEAVRLELSSLVADRMFDETSVWHGDRIADVLVETMGGMRESLAPLFERIVSAVVNGRGARAGYLASRVDDDWAAWGVRLLERDPAARRVAIDRLGQWVDIAEVRDLLLTCILDQGYGLGVEPPAMAAGRALRAAMRDEPFEGVRTQLRELLEYRVQLGSAAAAVALHPSEADPALLVAMLRQGSDGFAIPPKVLEELASSELGETALSSGWPEWRDYISKPQRARTSRQLRLSAPHLRFTRGSFVWPCRG